MRWSFLAQADERAGTSRGPASSRARGSSDRRRRSGNRAGAQSPASQFLSGIAAPEKEPVAGAVRASRAARSVALRETERRLPRGELPGREAEEGRAAAAGSLAAATGLSRASGPSAERPGASAHHSISSPGAGRLAGARTGTGAATEEKASEKLSEVRAVILPVYALLPRPFSQPSRRSVPVPAVRNESSRSGRLRGVAAGSVGEPHAQSPIDLVLEARSPRRPGGAAMGIPLIRRPKRSLPSPRRRLHPARASDVKECSDQERASQAAHRGGRRRSTGRRLLPPQVTPRSLLSWTLHALADLEEVGR